MSPKRQQPIADEPQDPPEPPIPPGYVSLRPKRTVERPRRRRSVWWGVAGFLAAVLAAIVVVVLISLPDDPRDDAGGTADAVAAALTAHDGGAVDSYLCATAPRPPQQATLLRQFGHATTIAVEDRGGQDAAATVVSADRPDVQLVLLLDKQDAGWCVAGPVPCPTLGRQPTAGDSLDDVCRDRPRPH